MGSRNREQYERRTLKEGEKVNRNGPIEDEEGRDPSEADYRGSGTDSSTGGTERVSWDVRRVRCSEGRDSLPKLRDESVIVDLTGTRLGRKETLNPEE